jgi:hypothetical protein
MVELLDIRSDGKADGPALSFEAPRSLPAELRIGNEFRVKARRREPRRQKTGYRIGGGSGIVERFQNSPGSKFTITTLDEKDVNMSDPTYSQVPQPGSFQPVPPPVAAPPPKSGPSALKIILIIVAIFAGLGIIGAGIIGYGVYRVAHSIHKDANGEITINTPKGAITENPNETITASDLGIAIYPGATQGKGSLRMTIGGKSMVTANFLTPDSPDKVFAFYKDKVGPNAQTMSTGSGGIITMQSGSNSVTVTVAQSPNENNGETQITIVNTTGTSSN